MHMRCKLQAYTKPPHTSSALLFKFSDQSLLNTLSWPYISETLCVWLSCLNEHTDFSHHKLWILTGGFGFASPPPPFNIHYYHNTNKSLINANTAWFCLWIVIGFVPGNGGVQYSRWTLLQVSTFPNPVTICPAASAGSCKNIKLCCPTVSSHTVHCIGSELTV